MIRLWSLVCGALLICALPAMAQGLRFGAKGGLNVATQDLSGSDVSPDPRYGIVAGGFVRMPIASWLDVQAEGLYSEKGSRVTVAGGKSTVIVDYCEVPVVGRVRLARLFFLEGGASMGFRLRAKTRARFSGATEEIDVSDQVERFDLGVAMGGGVELGRLLFDGRYTLGLTDVDKDKTDTTQVKNRTLSATVGIRF
jgi:hypothetical protein